MSPSALYTRVSSDKQKEGHTIDSQLGAILDYAEKEGYQIPREWYFMDEGYSGSNLVRPSLEKLRDLVFEGAIENLIVYSPDRLSRKYAHQIILLEEFKKHGANVIFIKSIKGTTPEEQLLVQFQGMISEYERAQIIERCRRGKLHKAKNGIANVLSGAPYGYNYIKKTEVSNAYYTINETEAKVVKEIFELYANGSNSINGIAKYLNQKKIPTKKNNSRWERSTVWGILKNPAYKGQACYGKTEQCERQRITRPLREKGGYTNRSNCSKDKPREQWIPISVPAIIEEDVFGITAEKLEQNKKMSKRRINQPTLLQNIMFCEQCGYSVSRTSTRTSKRKIFYYRCIGSDNYRHPNGKVCSSAPIRQDYLDELVWQEIIKLLESPELIQQEIQRRISEVSNNQASKNKKSALTKEINRLQKGIDNLLDAYSENLITLPELRKRIPELRKREETKHKELINLELQEENKTKYMALSHNIEQFLEQIRISSKTLDIQEKQKILRLVSQQIQMTG